MAATSSRQTAGNRRNRPRIVNEMQYLPAGTAQTTRDRNSGGFQRDRLLQSRLSSHDAGLNQEVMEMGE